MRVSCQRRVLWLVFFLASLLLLPACSSSDDEQLLRDTIVAMQAAAETGERRKFMVSVADDFLGEGYDRAQLANMIRAQLLRNDKIGVTTISVDVTLFPVEGGASTRATAQIRALLTGGGNWLPERGELYDFETAWRKSGSEWLLISAQWQAASG